MKNAQIIWSLKGGKTVGGSGESNWGKFHPVPGSDDRLDVKLAVRTQINFLEQMISTAEDQLTLDVVPSLGLFCSCHLKIMC